LLAALDVPSPIFLLMNGSLVRLKTWSERLVHTARIGTPGDLKVWSVHAITIPNGESASSILARILISVARLDRAT
jgi:hypothetical protein